MKREKAPCWQRVRDLARNDFARLDMHLSMGVAVGCSVICAVVSIWASPAAAVPWIGAAMAFLGAAKTASHASFSYRHLKQVTEMQEEAIEAFKRIVIEAVRENERDGELDTEGHRWT